MTELRPEPQVQDDYRKGVDLVRLISNEFGSSPDIIKMQILAGKVYLDDEEYIGEDRLFIPLDVIRGKEVKLIGPERRWRMRHTE